MAVQVGEIVAKLLIQMGDAEPIHAGNVHIDLTAVADRTSPEGDIIATVGTELAENVRAALMAAAGPRLPRSHDWDACPRGRSAAVCIVDCPEHRE